MVIDTSSWTVTAPAAAGAAMAAVAGDPTTIRNGTPGKMILLCGAWTLSQAVGFTQIIWPSGHDLVRNLRYRNVGADPRNKLAKFYPGSFRPQDPLTLFESGSAVAGDVELAHLMVMYEDLPGVAGRYANIDTIRKRGVAVTTYEDTVTPTAASTYSGARTFGQAANTFKANTDYAILGATLGIACGTLTIRGVDLGNLRSPIPGSLDVSVTAHWFAELSDDLDLPLIPVINSANAAGTFIEVVQNENLTAVPFSLTLVELAPTPAIAAAENASQVAAADRGNPQRT